MSSAAAPARAKWTEDGPFMALLLVLVVVLAYLPGIYGAGFHFDDFHSIRENDSVRSLGNIPRFFTDPQTWSAEPGNAMYRPVLLVTYAIDHAIWGYRASGWVLTNALLHAGVAVLTAKLARRLGLSAVAAAFAGAVTALHPVHSEVVNYVSARSESVSALLMLCALHLHLSARERRGAAVVPWMAGAALVYGLSLLTKETTAGFCLAAPLLEILLPARGGGSRWTRAAQALVAYGAVFAGVMMLRSYLLGHATAAVDLLPTNSKGDPRAGGRVSVADNVLKTQSRVVVLYYDLLFFPVRLSVDHAVTRTFGWLASAWLALAMHATIVAAAIRAWVRGCRLLPLCVGWFWFFLGPSVAFPLNVVMNEHRLYLPGIAVSLLVGAVLAHVLTRLRPDRRWCVLVPFACFAALAVHRSLEWRDDETLWHSATDREPESARAWQHRGAAVHAKRNLLSPDAGKEFLDEAIRYYEHSERLFPGNYDNQLNLGEAYLQLGRLTGDRKHYERSLAAYREAERILGWPAPRTQLSMAPVLAELGRVDEALAIVRAQRAGDRTVNDERPTKLYDDMEARLLRRKGDRPGAYAAMARVVEIEKRSDEVDALLTLGWWKMEDGDIFGARELLDAAMTIGKRTHDFRPVLYAARMLYLLRDAPQLGIDPKQIDRYMGDARTLGWGAPDDEVRWIHGGPTPGAVRTGTRAMPTYGDPR